jgi:predicted enzyme related to lactoylglutathione lyase
MVFSYTDAFVAIAADDIQILVDFYSKLFQHQPSVYHPPTYAEFQLEKLRIGIFKPKQEHQQQFANLSSSSSISICLEVKNLDVAIAHLNNIGYPPLGEIIKASHGKEIYAYDPGKNRLILHQSS